MNTRIAEASTAACEKGIKGGTSLLCDKPRQAWVEIVEMLQKGNVFILPQTLVGLAQTCCVGELA